MLPINRPPLVTIFGGGGFIGRQLCEILLRCGARLLIAQRNEGSVHVIQPLGQVGQIGYRPADLNHRESVAAAVKGADVVVNLVGTFKRMEQVHVAGARNLAEAAASAGVKTFVHVSAIGANPDSPSAYGRTKAAGEAAVREMFPGATIVRPSLVFGPDDQLTNRFAGLGQFPIVPVLKPEAKFQPVYVVDLAQAIAGAVLDPAMHAGKSYEIGGPQVLSMIALHRAIFALTGQSPALIPLPDVAGDFLSLFGFLPGAPITRDQWAMLGRDNVVHRDARGLADFEIEPTPLAAVGAEWLSRFRPGGRFSRRGTPSAVAN